MFEIILFIIVIAVIALVFSAWQYYRQQQQAKAFEQEMASGPGEEAADPFEQRFDSVLSQQIDDDIDIDDESPRVTLSDEASERYDADDAPAMNATGPETSETSQASPEPASTESAMPEEMLLALTVMAAEGAVFNGKAVRNALNEQDLHFGDMQIYHRFSTHSRNRIIFSVANVLDPGHLIPDRMLALQTPGLMLFTQLPGAINGMAMFDAMYECAQQLATRLDGHVCDQRRQPLTEQALEDIRSRIFEFNLSLQQDQENADYDDFR